jgi:MFS family permease
MQEHMTPGGGPSPLLIAQPHSRAGREAGIRDWYMVIVLTFFYILSFVDRGALSLVVGPIKQEFGIGDLQVSLLLGLSFVFLYSVLTIPAGYLADVVARRKLLAGAILVWSGMETACGLSTSYLRLFAGRLGLGVGEAALPPVAYSMLRDTFPPEKRGRAFAVYHMGPLFGTGLAFAGGGTILQLAAHGDFAAIPWLGTLKAWQLVLVIPGLIGVPLALLALTLREPPRATALEAQGQHYKEALRFMMSRWRLYFPLWGAVTLFSLSITGSISWLPEAVSRIWGVPRVSIGHSLGLINIIFVPAGLLVFGTLADRMQARGYRRAHAQLIVVTSLLAAFFTLLMPLLPTLGGAVAAYAAQSFVFASYASLSGALMAQITPGYLMGKLTAIYFMVSNLLGLATGPTVVVLVSRALFSGPGAIGYALVTTFVVSTVCGALLMIWMVRELARPGPAGEQASGTGTQR